MLRKNPDKETLARIVSLLGQYSTNWGDVAKRRPPGTKAFFNYLFGDVCRIHGLLRSMTAEQHVEVSNLILCYEGVTSTPSRDRRFILDGHSINVYSPLISFEDKHYMRAMRGNEEYWRWLRDTVHHFRGGVPKAAYFVCGLRPGSSRPCSWYWIEATTDSEESVTCDYFQTVSNWLARNSNALMEERRT